MISTVLPFLGPILQFLAEQYGIVGVVIAHLVAISIPVSLLIELLEAVVILTVTDKDDLAIARVKRIWTSKVLPVLELLPHVNVPIAPWVARGVLYLRKGASAARAAIDAWHRN